MDTDNSIPTDAAPSRPTCSTCRFYEFGLDDELGWCKRRAPILAGATASLFRASAFAPGDDKPDNELIALMGIWPATHHNECCGEFEHE